MRQWAQIKARCPQAKLVCIDLQPVATSQAVEREDVLHVGGFSDAVFEVVAAFAAGAGDAARWEQRIASMEL
jgi:60 kDa SS-A/Ro ribonucleoprotein